MATEVNRSAKLLMGHVPLYSKRNDVWRSRYDGEEVVVKEFADEADYWREKKVYRSLLSHAPILCPKVIEFLDVEKRLILPFVSSLTVLEALEKAEEAGDLQEGTMILSQLLAWLQEFYNHQKEEDRQWVMGDINLRNFLWVDRKVVGIDFEGWRFGDPSEEVLRLLAFYLSYEPVKTPYKASVVDSLLVSILRMTNRSALSFWGEVEEEMKRISNRRQGRTNR